MSNEEIIDNEVNQETKNPKPGSPWYGILLIGVGIVKLAGGRGIFGWISLICGIGLLGLYFYEANKYDND